MQWRKGLFGLFHGVCTLQAFWRLVSILVLDKPSCMLSSLLFFSSQGGLNPLQHHFPFIFNTSWSSFLRPASYYNLPTSILLRPLFPSKVSTSSYMERVSSIIWPRAFPSSPFFDLLLQIHFSCYIYVCRLAQFRSRTSHWAGHHLNKGKLLVGVTGMPWAFAIISAFASISI